MLRPEWFEPELLRRESERDDESGRDKRPLHNTHIFVDPAARYQKDQNWDGVELHDRLPEGSEMFLEEPLHFDAEASCRIGEAERFVEPAYRDIRSVHAEDGVALPGLMKFLGNRSHE